LATIQTWIAGGATFIAGVGTFYLIWTFRETKRSADAAVKAARAASEANELSRQSYVADQRPWLEVKMESGPIRWTKDWLSVDVHFCLVNHGRTPATNADITARIVPVYLNKDPTVTQAMLSDEVRAKEIKFGNIVFPHAKVTCPHRLPVPRPDIDGLFKTKDKEGQPFDWLLPCLVGCVDYQSALDGQRFQTGFIRTIDRFKDGRVTFGLVEAEGDIPPDRISLTPWAKPARIY
jgi:hypothetical protein